MRIAKNDIKARVNVPGAIARQELNFGDASGYGAIAGEYFSLAKGTPVTSMPKVLARRAVQPSLAFMTCAPQSRFQSAEPASARMVRGTAAGSAELHRIAAFVVAAQVSEGSSASSCARQRDLGNALALASHAAGRIVVVTLRA
jgi:hypothetical protein